MHGFYGRTGQVEKLARDRSHMTFGAISGTCDPARGNTDPGGISEGHLTPGRLGVSEKAMSIRSAPLDLGPGAGVEGAQCL
jgi:hypothetical protein